MTHRTRPPKPTPPSTLVQQQIIQIFERALQAEVALIIRVEFIGEAHTPSPPAYRARQLLYRVRQTMTPKYDSISIRQKDDEILFLIKTSMESLAKRVAAGEATLTASDETELQNL